MLFTIVKAVVKKVVKKVVSAVGHFMVSIFAPSVTNPTSVHLMNVMGRELIYAGGVFIGSTAGMTKYVGLPKYDEKRFLEARCRRLMTALSIICIIVGSVLLNVFPLSCSM